MGGKGTHQYQLFSVPGEQFHQILCIEYQQNSYKVEDQNKTPEYSIEQK